MRTKDIAPHGNHVHGLSFNPYKVQQLPEADAIVFKSLVHQKS